MNTALSIEMQIFLLGGIFVAMLVLLFVYRKIPKRLKQDKFVHKWRELQGYCRDKATWSQAVIHADKLLDEALKRRKFKGKSMGERMVSAQKYFTNNDDLWFAHNLCKKLKANERAKLKEADVKDALIGFRQGLRDLGALGNDKSAD
jgi:hypothetical protein